MSVRRNVVANHVGQAWAALVALVCLPLYVRYLGIEAFGMIGAFTVLQAALSLFDVPLAATVNREMARYTAGAHSASGIRAVLRTLEILCLAVAALILVAVVASRGYLAQSWFQTSTITAATVRDALLAMGIVVALRLGEGLYRGALYGLQRQVHYSVANAVLSTARFGGALAIVAYVSPTVEAFFLWQALTSAAAVIVLGAFVHRALPPAGQVGWSSAAFRDLRHFAGGVMGITLVSLGLTQADKVVLSRLLPLEAFGYYTLAVTISNALYKLSEPIMDAVYPRLTELVAARQTPGLIGALPRRRPARVGLRDPGLARVDGVRRRRASCVDGRPGRGRADGAGAHRVRRRRVPELPDDGALPPPARARLDVAGADRQRDLPRAAAPGAAVGHSALRARSARRRSGPSSTSPTSSSTSR